MRKTTLGVNIDHVATVREARKISIPDPVEAALLAEKAGCQGITAHLREDRRHIQDADVYRLRRAVQTRLNLELATAPDVVALALDVKPDQVTFVPERRQEITTEGGLDLLGATHLAAMIAKFKDRGIVVSLFIDPIDRQIDLAKKLGADFVEFHTGAYAEAEDSVKRDAEVKRVARAVGLAAKQGLRVNAGHGLNYQNTMEIAVLPEVEELNIGHAIVARSIMVGMPQAVFEMLQIIATANQNKLLGAQ